MAIIRPNEEDRTMQWQYSTGDGDMAGKSYPMSSKDPAGQAYMERSPVIVTDLKEDENFELREPLASLGVRSGMTVPLKVGNWVIGVLCFFYKDARNMNTAELWYMNVVGNSLAVYMEKEQARLKEAEATAYLTSVLESVGHGVIMVDTDLRIIFANRGYCESLNLFQEEVIGRHCHEVAHGLEMACDVADIECPVRRAIETKKPCPAQHTHKDKDGRELTVQLNAYPITDSSDKVVAVVETVFDITDRVALERDLEKRVAELEEFYDMAVGRELRMIELKEDVKRLKAELDSLKGERSRG